MQKDEILEFIGRINEYLRAYCTAQLQGRKFELRIFGKSALLLAGLTDSLGTNDIDLLKIKAELNSANEEITKILLAEFGRPRIAINGYYLEFVNDSSVLLPHDLTWTSLPGTHDCLSAEYLNPEYIIAAKLFSAFSDTIRKQDKQDIVAALDQELVDMKTICAIADKIFEKYKFDSRNARYPDVYRYIREELMPDYGNAPLTFDLDE